MPSPTVTISVSSVLSMGTGAQTNRGVGSTPGVTVEGTPEDGSVPLFSGPGPQAILVAFRYPTGDVIPVGRDSRQITRAQYEQRQRQRQNPIGNNRGDRKPRPTRGGSSGGSSSGGGGGFPGVTFSGSGSDRAGQMRVILVNPPRGFLNGDGTLSTAAQQALVAGLDAADFTAEIVALLDPENFLNFLVYDDGLGTISYIDARLETPLSLALLAYEPTMNFLTAYEHLLLGSPIGRVAWGENGVPEKWLVRKDGYVYIGTEGAWQIVTSERGEDEANLAVADLLAGDWVVSGASATVDTQPDLALAA